MLIYDIVGWIGMLLVLVAYFLLSLNKIDTGKTYQILNLVAAVFMAIGLFPKNAWFSFFLQMAWAIIALISLIKLFNKKINFFGKSCFMAFSFFLNFIKKTIDI